ncbi:hypothetical protein DENSPDRAFT_879710 [Dentipellis sp. KUC8613]|nr:hypothetical protein DENSPDRAFT_879710 [Dentipellis sp. KUC8613]
MADRTLTRTSTMTSLWSLGEMSGTSEDSIPHGFVRESEEVRSGKFVRHSEFYFNDGSLVVLVETTLFRIFASTLARHSRFFAHLFESSRLPGEPSTGFSENHPLKFEDVSVADFEQLLRVLYPRDLFLPPTLTATEWVAVLRLAAQWDFPSLRQLALQQLQTLPLPPVDKIVLSREHGVRARWTLDAYVELCERDEPLSMEEAGRLGLEVAMGVMRVRERVQNMKRRDGNGAKNGNSNGNRARGNSSASSASGSSSVSGSSATTGRWGGSRNGTATPSVMGSPTRVGSRRATVSGPLELLSSLGPSPGKAQSPGKMQSPARSAGGGVRQKQRHSVVARLAAQTFGLDLGETD